MTDVQTGNFAARKRAGEVIVNPLDYLSTSIKEIPSSAFISYGNPSFGTWTVDGCVTTFIKNTWFQSTWVHAPDPSVDTSKLIDIAQHRALASVDSSTYGFAEDTLEIRETLAFIRSPLNGLIKLFTPYKGKRNRLLRLKFKDAKAKAKALADLWATYSFAARPLFQSINDLIEAHSDTSVPALRRVARSKQSGHDETEVSGLRGAFGWNVQQHSRKSVDVTVHAGVIFESHGKYGWREKYGLRNRDLIVGVYEVIPLSFMLDRLYNVKGMINGLLTLAAPNVKILGGFTTVRTKTENMIWASSVTSNYPSQPKFVPSNTAPIVTKSFSMIREPWTPSIGNVVPRVTPGRLTDSLSSTLDLVSILIKRIL
jgi:hypothetical protein